MCGDFRTVESMIYAKTERGRHLVAINAAETFGHGDRAVNGRTRHYGRHGDYLIRSKSLRLVV